MSLDRLVKEIDVLTYNSRSVLNALIRSVLRYGTSDGYSVVKAGNTLTLSRKGIYLLYRLYNEWSGLGFTSDTFSEACTNVRTNFMPDSASGTVLISDAQNDDLLGSVITHSKILYMTSSNKDSGNQYWIDKITSSVNKMELLNSCPIPINLRTPVFDENMSTAEYSQYETYLLPMGYYMQAIMGSQGDDTEHSAGGKTWRFDIDEYFTLNSPNIALGGNDGSDRYDTRVSENVGGSLNSYSLAYGYNTKIVGRFCTAGGDSTYVLNCDNAHAISASSMVQGRYSGIYAGNRNQVYNSNGAISGGEDIVILGDHGFSANRMNSVGYYGMVFDVPDLTKLTEGCESIVNTCSDANQVSATYSPKNVVRLYYTKNKSTPYTIQNISAGDKVIIYDQSINGRNYLYWDKIEFLKQIAIVTSVKKYPTYQDIFLDANVNYSQYGVNGGRIARYAPASDLDNPFGINSTSFNYLTCAIGANQTVAGIANFPMEDPNFIVGTGYVPDGNTLATQYIDGEYITNGVYRSNGFMVARNYVVEKVNGYIESGIILNGNPDGPHRWVNTSDIASHADMYMEVTQGTYEFAINNATDINKDTTNYQVYHTNHIGVSDTKMSMGRYTTRTKTDNCIGSINFYDKDWFEDHKDVNSNGQPRNTIIEIIAQNGIRDLKSNINITNGYVNAKGYICTSRYSTDHSYGVWQDNPVYSSLYSDSEYIAISSANTLSLYSSNKVSLNSRSLIYMEGKYLDIEKNTETLGTLSLTGDAKSQSYWFDGDIARTMYGGFLIASAGKVRTMGTDYILPNREDSCWGFDEFLTGSTSAHVLSSVGGNNDIKDYDSSCSDESVKLVLPGPSYVEGVHPFMLRYKQHQVNSDGTENQAEIMQVDKLALLDDVVYKLKWGGTNGENDTFWYRVADIQVPGITVVNDDGKDVLVNGELYFVADVIGIGPRGGARYSLMLSIEVAKTLGATVDNLSVENTVCSSFTRTQVTTANAPDQTDLSNLTDGLKSALVSSKSTNYYTVSHWVGTPTKANPYGTWVTETITTGSGNGRDTGTTRTNEQSAYTPSIKAKLIRTQESDGSSPSKYQLWMQPSNEMDMYVYLVGTGAGGNGSLTWNFTQANGVSKNAYYYSPTGPTSGTIITL